MLRRACYLQVWPLESNPSNPHPFRCCNLFWPCGSFGLKIKQRHGLEGHPCGANPSAFFLIRFYISLKQHRASPHTAHNVFMLALHEAAQHGSASNVLALLQSGAAFVTDVTPTGTTALMIAAAHGHMEVVDCLLQHGVDPSASDSTDGSTALILAAGAGHTECMRKCFDAGASIFVRNQLGATPLHCAASGGYAECVRELLRYGARADAIDGDGRMPSDVAATEELREVLQSTVDEQHEEWSEKSYDSAQDDRPWH